MRVEVRRVSSFELRNLVGWDATPEALRIHEESVRRSNVMWLGLADGVEACVAGLISATVFAEEPYLWMIHTRICEQHPLRFIRWSRKVMDEVLALYPSVVGLCRVDNMYGHRWLEWLGARFDIGVTNGLERFRIARDG